MKISFIDIFVGISFLPNSMAHVIFHLSNKHFSIWIMKSSCPIGHIFIPHAFINITISISTSPIFLSIYMYILYITCQIDICRLFIFHRNINITLSCIRFFILLIISLCHHCQVFAINVSVQLSRRLLLIFKCSISDSRFFLIWFFLLCFFLSLL